MWYVYILQSLKNYRLYTGRSGDLKRRVSEHNSRRGGKYSKKNAPYRLIFYEAYLNKKDACNAEDFFKTGYGREVLQDKLKNYLK